VTALRRGHPLGSDAEAGYFEHQLEERSRRAGTPSILRRAHQTPGPGITWFVPSEPYAGRAQRAVHDRAHRVEDLRASSHVNSPTRGDVERVDHAARLGRS
jgi:hypothetical protein